MDQFLDKLLVLIRPGGWEILWKKISGAGGGGRGVGGLGEGGAYSELDNPTNIYFY